MNKYFTFNPVDNEFETYDTKEKQEEGAEEIIAFCRDDDEWSEWMEEIVMGVITKRATKCNIKKRPEGLDDYGLDKDGNHWPDGLAYKYDYQMEGDDG